MIAVSSPIPMATWCSMLSPTRCSAALPKAISARIFRQAIRKWRDASSDRFLAYAVQRLRERGGRIVLLDATILCERPKIGPQRDAMRARIAGIAGIGPERVSIKATTTEKTRLHGTR